jgi:hypothetical protein
MFEIYFGANYLPHLYRPVNADLPLTYLCVMRALILSAFVKEFPVAIF